MMVLDYRGYKFKGMRSRNVCLPIASIAQKQTVPSCSAFRPVSNLRCVNRSPNAAEARSEDKVGG
jgi:hypothetical protein